MMQKEWVLARSQAPPEHLRRYLDFSPILAQLLYGRGLEDPAQADTFISDTQLREDPLKMKDMESRGGADRRSHRGAAAHCRVRRFRCRWRLFDRSHDASLERFGR